MKNNFFQKRYVGVSKNEKSTLGREYYTISYFYSTILHEKKNQYDTQVVLSIVE